MTPRLGHAGPGPPSRPAAEPSREHDTALLPSQPALSATSNKRQVEHIWGLRRPLSSTHASGPGQYNAQDKRMGLVPKRAWGQGPSLSPSAGSFWCCGSFEFFA